MQASLNDLGTGFPPFEQAVALNVRRCSLLYVCFRVYWRFIIVYYVFSSPSLLSFVCSGVALKCGNVYTQNMTVGIFLLFRFRLFVAARVCFRTEVWYREPVLREGYDKLLAPLKFFRVLHNVFFLSFMSLRFIKILVTAALHRKHIVCIQWFFLCSAFYEGW